MKDHNPDSAETRCHRVGSRRTRGQPFLSLLEEMLNDKDVEVRLAAITSLADWKTRESRERAEQSTQRRGPGSQFRRCQGALRVHDPAGKRALLAILERREPRVSSGFLTKQKRDALRMLHTPRTTVMFGVKEGIALRAGAGLGRGSSRRYTACSRDPGVSGRAMAAPTASARSRTLRRCLRSARP